MIDEIKKLRELTETLTGQGYLDNRAAEWEYVLDALPDIIFIVNNVYEIKFINKELKHRLQLKRKKDVYDKACQDVFPGLPESISKNYINDVANLGEVYIEDLDGWFLINRAPIITDTNKLLGFIIVLKDITDKHDAEFDLQARQQMLETIYKASPIGIGIVEKDTRIIKFVNHAITDMLGYSEEQLVAQDARIIYPSDKEYERVGTKKHVNIEYNRVVSIETKWRRVDGVVLDIFLSSSLVPSGRDIVFTAMDITEVKRNEKNLKKNEERLEALLKLAKLSSLDEDVITNYALEEAVRLTDSNIGYLHFVQNDDTSNLSETEIDLTLFTWSEGTKKLCKAKPTNHYSLSSAGIWADSLRNRKPIIHNDYKIEENKKGLPEGHVELVRHLSVPVFDGQKIVAIAGVGNKEYNYDQTDVYQLSVFMNSMWGILSRKRAEKAIEENRLALKQSEQKFKAAFMTLPDPAIMLEAGTGRIVSANPAACRESGFSIDELMDQTITDMELWLSIDDRESFYEILNQYGKVENFPIKVKTRSGKIKEGIFSSRIFDLYGKPHILTIIKDISTVKLLKQSIDEAELFYKSVMDKIYEGVFLIQDEKIILINKPLCNMLGYEESELVDQHFLKIIAKNDRDRVYETYKARVSGRYALDKYETMLISKEGKEIHVLIDANAINYGGRVGSMGTITRID